MRCVPIKPLVLAPHTKKVPASTQNAGDRTATRSAAIGVKAVAGAPPATGQLAIRAADRGPQGGRA